MGVNWREKMLTLEVDLLLYVSMTASAFQFLNLMRFQAFTSGIFKEEEGVAEVTYRVLNRRIQCVFSSFMRRRAECTWTSLIGTLQNRVR
jgi:hypothetical protein